MKNLDLMVLQRPKAHYFLVMTYTRDMSTKELERQEDNDKINEDSIVNSEHTEVIVKKGDLRFEEEIRIDKKFFEKNDSIFLAAAGAHAAVPSWSPLPMLVLRHACLFLP